MPGNIARIQRFSTEDGPGIRTTVFLKGCNLNCEWCHNPETISPQNEMLYFAPLCTQCGLCVDVCAASAQSLLSGKHHFDRTLCTACGKCADVCIAKAMVLCGTQMTAKQVFDIIMEDYDFYFNSGGGITLSGGEPMLQAEFCREIVELCKQQNIHTIIDTAGCVNKENWDFVIGMVDEYYFDIKSTNQEKLFKKTTGDWNRIAKSLDYLLQKNCNITIRIPLIPHFNTSQDDIKESIDTIKKLKIPKVSLLPFHQLGSSKYKALEEEYFFANTCPPTKTEVSEITKLFNTEKIEINFEKSEESQWIK